MRSPVIADGDASLAESERRLAIATHAAAIGIWDWNLGDNSFVYSALAKQIFGLPIDEPVTYELIRSVTHPDDLPWTSALARQATDPAIRATEPYRYRIRRADTGEVRWILAHGEATFGEVGGAAKALRYIGTMQDITEQKRAEDALIDSEARLRLAVEASQMAVWELDLVAGTIAHSPQLNILCGFPPDAQPTLDDFRSRYAPGERERIEREGQAVQARGETQIQTEFRQVWPDGTERWMLLRAAVAPGSAGYGERVIGVLMDVTEHKLAEERTALVARELQHRFKNTLSIVQTIAMQTFRNKGNAGDAVESFFGRLRALAMATDIITLNDWSNASLSEVIDQITRPFRDPGRESFILTGDDIQLPSKVAVSLGMALHELCTNAAKYGALSTPSGRVLLDWQRAADNRLLIEWREQDGPPVSAPKRSGFGTKLLERSLFVEPVGKVDLRFDPLGVIVRIEVQL
jgi:PAS domain S-box-containing protein